MSVAERCVEIGVTTITIAMRLVESMRRNTSAYLLAGNGVESAEFFIVEQALAVLLFEPLIAKCNLLREVCFSDVSKPLILGMCTKPAFESKLVEVSPDTHSIR